MKLFRVFLIGIFFGIVLTRAEVISWFRIQEMFLFDSFYMYGIIASAIITAMIFIQILQKFAIKSFDKEAIEIKHKITDKRALIVGGTIFGMGWALTGACPGPMYALLGNGYSVAIVMLAAALLGTFSYAMLAPRLSK